MQCASDFDFWIGDWTVRQRILGADGRWLEMDATTSVSRTPANCLITENWAGQVQFFWEGMVAPEQIWGYSVRVFDPSTAQWSIYWMDSRAPRFGTPHVGRFRVGRGEFFRRVDAADGVRLDRIVFSTTRPGIVDWELAVSSNDGSTWTQIWTMEMSRR